MYIGPWQEYLLSRQTEKYDPQKYFKSENYDKIQEILYKSRNSNTLKRNLKRLPTLSSNKPQSVPILGQNDMEVYTPISTLSSLSEPISGILSRQLKTRTRSELIQAKLPSLNKRTGYQSHNSLAESSYIKNKKSRNKLRKIKLLKPPKQFLSSNVLTDPNTNCRDQDLHQVEKEPLSDTSVSTTIVSDVIHPISASQAIPIIRDITLDEIQILTISKYFELSTPKNMQKVEDIVINSSDFVNNITNVTNITSHNDLLTKDIESNYDLVSSCEDRKINSKDDTNETEKSYLEVLNGLCIADENISRIGDSADYLLKWILELDIP